jgi:hypothetical protein
MASTRGNEESAISMTTPLSFSRAGVISRSWRITGWSGPKQSPDAMRQSRE